MRFLIDNQLPAALAGAFQAGGFETVHVLDAGLDDAPDSEIIRYATLHGFVIVTKDEDFSVFAALGKCDAPVVWVRLGNCRKSTLMRAFSTSMNLIMERIDAGEMLVELRD